MLKRVGVEGKILCMFCLVFLFAKVSVMRTKSCCRGPTAVCWILPCKGAPRGGSNVLVTSVFLLCPGCSSCAGLRALSILEDASQRFERQRHRQLQVHQCQVIHISCSALLLLVSVCTAALFRFLEYPQRLAVVESRSDV